MLLWQIQLKDVLVLGNFDVTAKAIATGFPYTGTWYNLMDNTTINVTDASAPLLLKQVVLEFMEIK
jgi:hypothetical protein